MRSVLLSAIVVVAACKGGGAAEDATEATPAAAPDMATSYLAVGEKLAADSADGVDALGKEIASAAQASKTAPGMAAVLEGASKLAPGDLTAARTAFQAVSNGYIQYLVANPAKQDGLQLVHCPMAFDGAGGYWVQKPGKVMNPYEGSRMLHCGEVTDWANAPKS